MRRWTAPDLTDDERRCLDAIEAIDWDGPEWSTQQKAEWEAMASDPDWYGRRKAEWASILGGTDGRIDCTQPDGGRKTKRGTRRDPDRDPGLLPLA